MKRIDTIRAWKDEDYRNGLSAEDRAQLPENPAGIVELADEDLLSVTGGDAHCTCTCCTCCTCTCCTCCCGGGVSTIE